MNLIMASALSIGSLVNSAVMSYDFNSSSASILSPVILSRETQFVQPVVTGLQLGIWRFRR